MTAAESATPWMRRLLVGSLLLNAAFVAAILLLVTAFDDLVGAYMLDPAWERSFTLFEALQVQPGDVVFLGDSITAGGSWAELFPGVPVRNRGIIGDTSQGVLDRLEQIARGRPGQLFVMIGTNDLAIGKSPASVAANVETLLARMCEGSRDTELFVQSVLPRGGSYRDRITELNERLQGVATEHGAKFIDLVPVFLEADGSLDDSVTNDELHLLAEGYRRWREALVPHVRGASALR